MQPQLSLMYTFDLLTLNPGRSAANDPVLAAVLNASADAVCLVGKAHGYQVDVALEIPRPENIDNIARNGDEGFFSEQMTCFGNATRSLQCSSLG